MIQYTYFILHPCYRCVKLDIELLTLKLSETKHNFHFIDIGANQGLYSILAAKNIFCQTVMAFEPVSQTADICHSNIQLNQVSKKVHLIRKAIDQKNGSTEISLSNSHSGVATLSNRDKNGFNERETIQTVNHKALNSLFPKDNLSIIIKIDVEGYEETVLKELFKTNSFKNVKQIFYECDETWINAESIQQLLQQYGFSCQKIGNDDKHYDMLASRE